MAASIRRVSSCFLPFYRGFNMFLYVLTLFHLYTEVSALPDFPDVTFDLLYNAGVDAYSKERWYECRSYMLRAIEDFTFYKDTVVDCRRTCQAVVRFKEEKPNLSESVLLGNIIHRSNCIRRCINKKFNHRPESVNRKVEKEFDALKPYDYLQYCSFKVEKYAEATAAAYTYFLANLDNEIVQKNIQYYRRLPQVKTAYFKNLEEKPYQTHYIKAADAYNKEEWLTVIENMERATREYYKEYESCLLYCEGTYDHASLPNFYTAVSDHYISVLKCQQKCTPKLDQIYGQPVEDFIADCYHYLQFAYFKVEEYDHAAECAGTFLLFKPRDETMLANKRAYLKLKGIRESNFMPRQEALHHHEPRVFASKLLKYVEDHYVFSTEEADLDDDEGDFEELFLGGVSEVTLGERAKRDVELQAMETNLGLKVAEETKFLQGKKRVVVDGFLTDEQCSGLQKMANIGGVTSDGYEYAKKKSISPHTDHEMFHGMTVDRAAVLAKEGKVDATVARLFLNISEQTRQYIEKYFNLRQPLYLHFTHLVCRTALADGEEHDDLSHPIHADNCIMTDDGKCVKKLPAYIWRDYTALLYINQNFEGGEFFFADREKTVQSSVKPKCGRLVSFSSSDYHGVRAVKSGQRCAIALWFTLDKMYKENAHAAANSVLNKLNSNSSPEASKTELSEEKLKLTPPDAQSSADDDAYKTAKRELLSEYEEKGVHLKYTEADLNGPMRFAVDNLASKEECQKVMDLANTGGVQGDGYSKSDKRPSPHTMHEKFVGIDVRRAYQVGVEKDSDETTAKGGLTIESALELASQNKVSVEGVKLYLSLSEKTRAYVAKYFELEKPLYFHFTHLVCRTALPDAQNENKKRQDLSHPIHSDNCMIQPDGSCLKKPPAYVNRDFSALLYLNGNFEGGEFMFNHRNSSIQATVKPECGRMVAFNSSNYHGVLPIYKGQRCAIALWFTLNEHDQETVHNQAWEVLKSLDKPLGPSAHTEL